MGFDQRYAPTSSEIDLPVSSILVVIATGIAASRREAHRTPISEAVGTSSHPLAISSQFKKDANSRECCRYIAELL